MSRQANPAVVGAFVIGAVALVIAGIFIFSGLVLFGGPRLTVVSVFPGAVRGLNVGSAVQFRGVKVGEVSEIRLTYDRNQREVHIPVYMKLSRAPVQDLESGETLLETFGFEGLEDELQALVTQGLRAQLTLVSLVTGQVIVELDFHPETPADLTGVDDAYVEIPTLPTPLDRLRDIFNRLPLHAMAEQLGSTLESIDRLARSDELKQAIRNASLAMKEASTLLAKLNQEVQPLADSTEETLTQVRHSMVRLETALTGTLASADALIGTVNERVDPLSDAALKLLNEASGTVQELDGLVGRGSDTRFQLDLALKEIAAAARALRVMAEYLERHPDALLKGKGY